jgi:hypothetical protein
MAKKDSIYLLLIHPPLSNPTIYTKIFGRWVNVWHKVGFELKLSVIHHVSFCWMQLMVDWWLKRRRVNELYSFLFSGIPPFVFSFVLDLVVVANYGFGFCGGFLRFGDASFMDFWETFNRYGTLWLWYHQWFALAMIKLGYWLIFLHVVCVLWICLSVIDRSIFWVVWSS